MVIANAFSASATGMVRRALPTPGRGPTIELLPGSAPLPRLQKLPGSATNGAFLYDDSFLGEDVSRAHCPCHGQPDRSRPAVVPGRNRWSRQLVLACARCNGDKGGAMPAIGIMDRVLGRDLAVLEQISAELAWPIQRDRVIAAARGLCRGNPRIPTWASFKHSVRLDGSDS
jgi:hypothetical protein